MKKTFILGVTGFIGSGKSTLCRFLHEKYGFNWINADSLVHELYGFGMPGYKKIKKYFGDNFVGKTGVKREILRDFVSKNPKKILLLNKLIHPLVFKDVNKKVVQLKRLHKGKKQLLVCIEATYFDEKNLGKFIDQFVFVDAPDKKILKRLKGRKIPKNHLQALLNFQRKTFKEKGTYIKNDGTLKDFYKDVVKLCRTYGYS